MSNMALEATYENLIYHYLEDTIGRNDDLFYFVRILSGLSSGSAVALNAAWGSGKTFFVKQAKMLIDIHNPNSDIDVEYLNEEEIASIKKSITNIILVQKSMICPKWRQYITMHGSMMIRRIRYCLCFTVS